MALSNRLRTHLTTIKRKKEGEHEAEIIMERDGGGTAGVTSQGEMRGTYAVRTTMEKIEVVTHDHSYHTTVIDGKTGGGDENGEQGRTEELVVERRTTTGPDEGGAVFLCNTWENGTELQLTAQRGTESKFRF